MGASRTRHWIVRGDHPMTSFFTRVAGPLAAVTLTATAFTAGLWVQRSRNAWPFVASVSGETLTTNPMVNQNTNASAADSRVPIAVTAATMQQLGIRLATV